jgi:NADH:ubiquinone oxidoreductase subunit K
MSLTLTQVVVFGILGLMGVGFYGLLISRNLIKLVVALQIIVKGAILALVAAGNMTGHVNVSQGCALTVIVADTIVAIIGLSFAVQMRQQLGTLDIHKLSKLKR